MINHNTERINRYLQHEMNADEKAAFEADLLKDESLRDELHAQEQVLKAVMHAGIKGEFAKAMKHTTITRRFRTWGILAAACFAGILLFSLRGYILPGNNAGNMILEKKVLADIIQPFINPPLARINVPLDQYSFDAEKGDTILYPSGSVIYFPPSALVDKAGNPVKGKVTVTYREFSDPMDFFVSGIPMSYDSAGQKYYFESAAMCEINAYKDNSPVFVNPKAKPEINLSCINKDPKQNLYFLDTVNRRWNYIGKDKITEVKNLAQPKTVAQPDNIETATAALPVKPVKPVKASFDKQSFSIEIEPGSFQELQAYNGLKFEVVDESTFKGSDADELWSDVKLKRSNTDGIYNVSFSKPGRTVTYTVRPVLKEGDYDAAMLVFKEKEKAYEQAKKSRLAKEKIFSDSIAQDYSMRDAKMKEDYEWNEKMNKLIKERNSKMKEMAAIRKKEMQAQLDAIEKQQEKQAAITQENVVKNQQWQRWEKDQNKTSEIIRSFPISNFGFWNCDQPWHDPNSIIITSAFTDSLHNNLQFAYVGVVNKGTNAIMQFVEADQIAVLPGKENMIWGIKDGSFYYFTYNDFAATGINDNTKSYTFKMRRTEKEIASYNDIKTLVGKL